MSRRKRGRPVHGIVLLDKPRGLSSNQALQKVRRIFDAQKAGHTGSLDPFATGMLPVCLGEATKTAAFMLDADKRYRATLRLGEATATGDPEGEVVHHLPVPSLEGTAIEAVLERFRGGIRQVPPMYSALKHAGKPLYEYARAGITLERPARLVTIHELRLLRWDRPELDFEVHCSKGTYVRTLAEDLATALGTCGHLVALRRLTVAGFEGRAMVTLDGLKATAEEGQLSRYLLAVDAGLAAWPVVVLAPGAARAFGNGNPVSLAATDGLVRVYDEAGLVLGLGQSGDGQLSPRRVFMGADGPGVSLGPAK